MKTKKNSSFIVAFAVMGLIAVIAMTSCNNENLNDLTLPQEMDNQSIEILGIKVAVEEKTLSFTNENELQDLIYKVKKQQYVSTRQSIEAFADKGNETFSIDGFTSLYDVFVDAMMNAESYYDREGGYEEFKEKYSTLYFPETKDDISAYLPVSDPYLAKFLNEDGEIIIAGETINMKDISSYEQLKELNLTPPEDVENKTIEPMQSGIPLIENYWGGTPTLITIGTSTVIGQRKIGVDNCKVIDNRPVSINARFDIIFRKRGFLNVWYNHWALTKNRIYIFLPQQDYDIINPSSFFRFVPQTHEGYSSHEEIFATEDWFTSVKNLNGGGRLRRVSIQVQIYYDALRTYNFYVPIINYEWNY